MATVPRNEPPMDWGAILGDPKHAGAPMRKGKQPVGEPAGEPAKDEDYPVSPYGVRISPKRPLEMRGNVLAVRFVPVRHRTKPTGGGKGGKEKGVGFAMGNLFGITNANEWRRMLRKEDWVIIKQTLADRHGADNVQKLLRSIAGRWPSFPGDSSLLQNLPMYLTMPMADHSHALDPEIFPFSKWPCLKEYDSVSLTYLKSTVLKTKLGELQLPKNEYLALRNRMIAELTRKKDLKTFHVASMSPYSEVFFTNDKDIPSTLVNDTMTVLTKMSVVLPKTAQEKKNALSIEELADYCADVIRAMHSYAIHRVYYTDANGDPDYVARANLPPPLLFRGNSKTVFGKRPPAGTSRASSSSTASPVDSEFYKIIGHLAYATLMVHPETREYASAALYTSSIRSEFYQHVPVPYDPSDDRGTRGGYLFSVKMSPKICRVLPFYLRTIAPYTDTNKNAPDLASIMELKVSQSSWYAWLEAMDRAKPSDKSTRFYEEFDTVEHELMLIMWTAIARCGCSIRFGTQANIFDTFSQVAMNQSTFQTMANAEQLALHGRWETFQGYGANVTHMHVMGDALGALRHYVAVDHVMFRLYPQINRSLDAKAITDAISKTDRLKLKVIHNSGIPSIEKRTLSQTPTWIADMNQVTYDNQPTFQIAERGSEVAHATTGYVTFERFDEVEDGIVMHQIGVDRTIPGTGTDPSVTVRSAWTPWRTLTYSHPTGAGSVGNILIHIVPGKLTLKAPLMRAVPEKEGYFRPVADLANEQIRWTYRVERVHKLSKYERSGIKLGSEKGPVIYDYSIVNYDNIKTSEPESYYPIHQQRECGHILRDGTNDIGISLNAWMFEGRSKFTSPTDTKANIISIAKVEGFRIPDTPGITLHFDVLVRRHPGKTINGEKKSFAAVFLGNLQLRGNRESWRNAWRASYDASLPEDFPPDYRIGSAEVSRLQHQLLEAEPSSSRISLGGDDGDVAFDLESELQLRRDAAIALKRRIDEDYAALPFGVVDDPEQALKLFDDFIGAYSSWSTRGGDVGESTFLGE